MVLEVNALADWRAFAAQLDADEPLPEGWYAVALGGASAERLAQYWEHGKGALKVRWGTSGAMKRCIRLNRKHMVDPGGYCAKRHHAVTGEWPTEHGKAGIPS